MSNAGHPKPVLCDNLAGGMGWGGRFKKEGTDAYLWLSHVDT